MIRKSSSGSKGNCLRKERLQDFVSTTREWSVWEDGFPPRGCHSLL